jgi:8-oxo-dGTP pyrophosphatase MutT (NUDIX family)
MENKIQKEAVVAIIQKSNKFLFVKRSDYKQSATGFWCPVSGRVEENESQAEALQREVKEEVGLNVVAIEKICAIPSHNGEFLLHFWTTDILSGEVAITSDEATDFKWVTLEEMKQLRPVFEEDIQVFEMFLNKDHLQSS